MTFASNLLQNGSKKKKTVLSPETTTHHCKQYIKAFHKQDVGLVCVQYMMLTQN